MDSHRSVANNRRNLYVCFFMMHQFYTLAVMAIGILNIVAGYKDYKYSKELLQRPIAIISRY